MKFKYIYSRCFFTRQVLVLVVLLALLSGCKKWYDIPEDKDYFNERLDYTVRTFSPVLGRTTVFTNIFNHNNSSLPLKFEMLNVRNPDGTPADNLTKMQPVWIWKSAYTGEEVSLKEIRDKRTEEVHPLWELRKSGEFVLWQSATNELIPGYQGSAALGSYLFDVKVSNSGGEKTIKDLAFSPLREMAYDPANRDAVTGLLKDSILPTELSGMIGQTTRKMLSNAAKDVYVYFRKVGNGSSLSFKFLNKDNTPINTDAFEDTQWEGLVHGFNMQRSPEAVRYDVAYPIPLVKRPTKYTTGDGSKASVEFSYNRLGFNGVRETGKIKLSFSIFQEGDWEIIFHFRNESPRFQDDY